MPRLGSSPLESCLSPSRGRDANSDGSEGALRKYPNSGACVRAGGPFAAGGGAAAAGGGETADLVGPGRDCCDGDLSLRVSFRIGEKEDLN
mmetsp:Transcript_101506/g.191044  ORF Transcript_101506/g.191044 Transcript_101506/m.191044 type:complete len:91 (-) Transcript_101506:303-575(-)